MGVGRGSGEWADLVMHAKAYLLKYSDMYETCHKAASDIDMYGCSASTDDNSTTLAKA